MKEQFSRTAILLGEDAVDSLMNKKVCLFGLGGVGGFVAEALARAGVGHFVLVDNDTVSKTNINRQIIATLDTIGMNKVDLVAKRILSINEDAIIEKKQMFYLPEMKDEFDFSSYDYVIDAIDTIKAKIDIIEECTKTKTKIISCMGVGNKLDPSKLQITDIYKTSVDPLARVMRTELKKRRIKKCKVLFSTEYPLKPKESAGVNMEMAEMKAGGGSRRALPGSVSFVPSVAGLMIGGYVIRDLTGLL